MTRQRLLGVLLFFALVAFTLWLSWPPTLTPRPVDYVCADEDTLTVVMVDTARVRLLQPDLADALLGRQSSQFGTMYHDSTSGVLFWARGPFAVLHEKDRIVRYGCTAESASAAREDSVRWYASNAHNQGWRFALSHPSDAQISRPNDRHTRLLRVGPHNEPPALTDGLSLVLGIHGHRGPVRGYVQNEIDSPKPPDRPVLSAPSDTTHRGRKAIVWRQESAMGMPVTHWAIRLNSGTVATISVSITGPNSEYDELRADSMLQSLRFWPSSSLLSDSMSVPLAILTEPTGEPKRGCEDIEFIQHRVPQSDDRVSAALNALFSIQADSVEGARHFLSQTNATLQFDRVDVNNDTAHVYLQGRLSGLRGVCDNPRARIQIEETIRRVAAARTVELYLNGTPTDLQPDQRGNPS